MRPPLVQDLFDPSFHQVLARYPRAEAAAADIRHGLANEALVIEQYLRKSLRDGNRYDQLRYWAVPLYLQDLFVETARGYPLQPDNYDRLINSALSLNLEVVFVTLNYDTLLDDRLAIYRRLDSLEAYIDPAEAWSLIKLHGSVNWGRLVLNPPSQLAGGENESAHFSRTFESVGVPELSDEIALRPGALRQARLGRRDPPQLYFPALSVPLGSADELVSPPAHVAFLKNWLDAQERLNVLVIGYSGLDQEVLRLLKASGSRLASLLVVNGSKERGVATLARFAQALGVRISEEHAFEGGFGVFVASPSMRDFFSLVAAQDNAS